jgi:hypothetical protein
MSSSDAIANTDLAGQTDHQRKGRRSRPLQHAPSPTRLEGEHLHHVSRGATVLMSTCNRATPHVYLPPHHLAPRVATPMSMHERHKATTLVFCAHQTSTKLTTPRGHLHCDHDRWQGGGAMGKSPVARWGSPRVTVGRATRETVL